VASPDAIIGSAGKLKKKKTGDLSSSKRGGLRRDVQASGTGTPRIDRNDG